jgi:hypothetical protein
VVARRPKRPHAKVSTTMALYIHSYSSDLPAAVGKLGAAIG